MTLTNFVDSHASRQLTLTVYSQQPYRELADIFDQPNVEITWKRLPDTGSEGFVVVEDDTGFRGSVSLPVVDTLLDPERIPEPGTRMLRTSGLTHLFELVREATFTSFDRRTLLMTAREFEDRAWRSTGGELHAGFQRPAALQSQEQLYTDLATHSGLDVHIYADPDWSIPDIPGATIHRSGGPDLGDVWFVVFDGGELPEDACALLAVELTDGHYYGFWTYDTHTIGEILDILKIEYA